MTWESPRHAELTGNAGNSGLSVLLGVIHGDMLPPVDGEVALVTGASRGLGRGIAVALGAAGWTVWVTGRSARASGPTSHLPGTVEDTADAVTAAGGTGVAASCDHRDDSQARALAARIGAGPGRLDLLVNNVWGGYERLNAGAWDREAAGIVLKRDRLAQY